MKQEIIMGFGDVVASAGPYAKRSALPLHTDNRTNTPSLNFYRPDALRDAQPTLIKALKVKMPPKEGTYVK